MKTSIRVTLGTALLASLGACTTAPTDGPSTPADPNPHTTTATGTAPIAPSAGTPVQTVVAYLGDGASGDFAVDRELSSHLGTHVRLQQEVDGLPVVGRYVKATVDANGDLVHIITDLAAVPADGLLTASIDDTDAVALAVAHHYPRARPDDRALFYRAPSATRVAIPLASGDLEEGFLVETWTLADNQLHHTLIGRDGAVRAVQLRTNTDSYNVFADHPGNSNQAIVAGPGGDVWLFAGNHRTIDIAGNNVNAYLDANNDNAPDSGGATVSDGNFVAVANLAESPATDTNRAVGVQNLFYLNNVIHDKLYAHGFVEAAGNFQEDNFGNGGAGGDSVNAEAQDGGGTDNANFSTPSDGSNPRMQMYVWTQTSPNRDGDVDSDIVWHEYCHGLTWRMIGNMSGPMSGAIGEGMSDVCAIFTNDDDVVGEYSYANPLGIRSAAYSGYGRTYGDFSGSSVHFDGEIYAAIMWDLKTTSGLPVDTLWDYVVGGMSFTPAGPAFEDMRDGLLAASSADDCAIWASFARFGVGVGAKGQVKGGGPFGGGKVSITESFELPAECGGGGGGGTTCDNAADGVCPTDCPDDPDCGDTGGTCDLAPIGAECTVDGDCCSNKCKGPSGRKTCK